MKQRLIALATGFVLFATLIILMAQNRVTANPQAHLIPSLPRPIAEETILITSVGQSTDTYIIKDIANKLLIHTLFMPQATEDDLDGVKTVVFVIGYSNLSEKVNQLDFETEMIRLDALLSQAKYDHMKVIALYVGGTQRRSAKTDAFLDQILPNSHYIIATTEGDFDHKISDIASTSDIPLTLVEEINAVSEPFASAFR